MIVEVPDKVCDYCWGNGYCLTCTFWLKGDEDSPKGECQPKNGIAFPSKRQVVGLHRT